jgi:hypothetical protein
MHVNAVYELRQALKLDPPGTPVKVVEPFQMLGEIAPDLLDALGVDVLGVGKPTTFFGFTNQNWKEWETFQGTPVLVPGGFNTQVEPAGDLYLYPEGDASARPSGRMPAGGYYFDAVVQQEPIDENKLDPADNLEEFGPIPDDVAAHFRNEVERIYNETDKAIAVNFGDTGFGDIALVPAPWMKEPKGIRGIEEWYVSTMIRRDYVYEVFDRQCEIALGNLKRMAGELGDKVDVVFMTGTDFGAQDAPFVSEATYRELYMPFHKRLNDWVHEHTGWKTFIHSCGSVRTLIPSFIEAGFDILNPVQCSAADMDAQELKDAFGRDVTFWGGGVDTQQTLPFGTPEQVREQTRERIRILGEGGGFVFNTIHNVQSGTPVENLLAMYETVRDEGAYPVAK